MTTNDGSSPGGGGGAGAYLLSEIRNVKSGTKFKIRVGKGGIGGTGIVNTGLIAPKGGDATSSSVTVHDRLRIRSYGGKGGYGGNQNLSAVGGGTGGECDVWSDDHHFRLLIGSRGQDGHAAENSYDLKAGNGGSAAFGMCVFCFFGDVDGVYVDRWRRRAGWNATRLRRPNHTRHCFSIKWNRWSICRWWWRWWCRK